MSPISMNDRGEAIFSSGPPSVTSDTLTAANSPYTIDIETALGRKGNGGAVLNDATTLVSMTVQLLHDAGGSYDSAITLQSGESLDLRGRSISAVKLTRVGSDCAFRVTVW